MVSALITEPNDFGLCGEASEREGHAIGEERNSRTRRNSSLLISRDLFLNYQKLIENSNVVAKKIKDKLTLLDVEGNISVDSSSLSTPIDLEPMP